MSEWKEKPTPERQIAETFFKVGLEMGSENNGWIPCSERLPENQLDVLVYERNRGVVIGFCASDGQWANDAINFSGVTHWQPLPDPPKE